MMFRLFHIHPLLPTLVFLISFSALLPAQVKVDAARSEWMKGYVKLENADKANQEGNKLAALQLYREAVVVFEAVRRQFPQWNPSLLNFRIKYCQQKIAELDKSVQSEAEGMSREKLLELTAKQAQMMHDHSLKIQQLNTSVSILTEALQRARSEAAKNAAAESDFSALQTARQELENRCRLLQSKLEKVEADLEESRKQAADRKLLQKLRDETQQQAEQLKESTRQIALLQGNLKTLQAELDKARLDNERQSRAGQDYEKRLQAATSRVLELTGMFNELHVQHNALKLKTQQQEVDVNFQKENNARLNNEKQELAAEVKQLRDIRDKFATTQDANQTLRTQVLDYQNRLQESLEKNRFEVQKRDEQIEKLQAERQSAMDALAAAKAEQARMKQPDLETTIDEVNREKGRLGEALRISEEKRLLLEKKLQENTEGSQLQQEYAALQTAYAQLKIQTENMQEATQNLKHSQEYALTLEKQLQQLREEQKTFSDISKQLQEKDALLSSRDETLRQQAERLAAANALVLTKSDEIQSARVEIQGLKRKVSDMETLNARLNEQLTGVIRRLADYDKENVDLKARLVEEAQRRGELQQQLEKNQQELEAKTALSIRLEKAIAGAEQKSEELGKQLAAEQQKMRTLQEDLSSSKTKSEAVDGLTSNLIDLQNQLKARTQELAQAKNDLQAGQTQLSVMTEQLKRRDEQVKELAAVKESQTERIWLNRLADLNSKLEQEENRRKALEIALIQKEAESRKTAAAEPPAATPSSSPVTNQAPSGSSYTEKEVLINGFLRQALDAERSQKTEAAVWNYQKVLELEPAHLLALKRLGLIAANTGNDDDTVKYLKLAFRYDPDDTNVLLALGYAMINLRQPEWAFSYLGRAVALEPANPTLSRLFGGALVDLGWTQAAEAQFSKALRLNPKDPHSAFNLAVLCATANPPRMEEAKKWYNQAVRNGAEKDPRFEAEFK